MSENVCVAFSDSINGNTTAEFVAVKETYGATKLWCLLKPIPIDCDSPDAGGTSANAQNEEGGSSSPSSSSDDDQVIGQKAKKKRKAVVEDLD